MLVKFLIFDVGKRDKHCLKKHYNLPLMLIKLNSPNSVKDTN